MPVQFLTDAGRHPEQPLHERKFRKHGCCTGEPWQDCLIAALILLVPPPSNRSICVACTKAVVSLSRFNLVIVANVNRASFLQHKILQHLPYL